MAFNLKKKILTQTTPGQVAKYDVDNFTVFLCYDPNKSPSTMTDLDSFSAPCILQPAETDTCSVCR